MLWTIFFSKGHVPVMRANDPEMDFALRHEGYVFTHYDKMLINKEYNCSGKEILESQRLITKSHWALNYPSGSNMVARSA